MISLKKFLKTKMILIKSSLIAIDFFETQESIITCVQFD
jgi:hypothetical protein